MLVGNWETALQWADPAKVGLEDLFIFTAKPDTAYEFIVPIVQLLQCLLDDSSLLTPTAPSCTVVNQCRKDSFSLSLLELVHSVLSGDPLVPSDASCPISSSQDIWRHWFPCQDIVIWGCTANNGLKNKYCMESETWLLSFLKLPHFFCCTVDLAFLPNRAAPPLRTQCCPSGSLLSVRDLEGFCSVDQYALQTLCPSPQMLTLLDANIKVLSFHNKWWKHFPHCVLICD